MNATKAEVLRHYPSARRVRSRQPAFGPGSEYIGFPHEIRVTTFDKFTHSASHEVIGKGMTSATAWQDALAQCLAKALLI